MFPLLLCNSIYVSQSNDYVQICFLNRPGADLLQKRFSLKFVNVHVECGLYT